MELFKRLVRSSPSQTRTDITGAIYLHSARLFPMIAGRSVFLLLRDRKHEREIQPDWGIPKLFE